MKIIHFTGRVLQLAGLLALPSAIWAAEIQRSEALAVSVLVGSILIFFIGWILSRRYH